ncbi:MAG: superoxide dismutase family protein [Anaerolineae bacterium]|nr:superoxide dismutase family protein [Anaerolineae bacterium]
MSKHHFLFIIGVMAITVVIGNIGVPAWTQATKVTASLTDAAGKTIGQATFTVVDQTQTQVSIEIKGAEKGFHGVHIHAVGACDAKTERPFTSVGSHLVVGKEALKHPHHSGDLPSLLVMADGTASTTFVTDRFAIGDLLDADGSAVIFHAGQDNHAHIPTDRYDPDPDETTLNTGDAGGRAACGIIKAS